MTFHQSEKHIKKYTRHISTGMEMEDKVSLMLRGCEIPFVWYECMTNNSISYSARNL